ncbi:MAG TPA: hypothetical protein VKO35_08860, partial [Acidimicrobiia bacterium]|nr:hypothetical protein [Acidimicrobiia bacterium]
MRPGNPIGRLLRLREIREEQARGVLASAAKAASEAARSVEARREEYDSRPPYPATLTPAELRGLTLQGVRAHELVADAIVVYNEALGHTERARAGWASASADLKSAEKLDQRRRIEADRLARAAAERALDELVLTLR